MYKFITKKGLEKTLTQSYKSGVEVGLINGASDLVVGAGTVAAAELAGWGINKVAHRRALKKFDRAMNELCQKTTYEEGGETYVD